MPASIKGAKGALWMFFFVTSRMIKIYKMNVKQAPMAQIKDPSIPK